MIRRSLLFAAVLAAPLLGAVAGGNTTPAGQHQYTVEQVGEEKAAAVTIGGESRREIREPGAAYVKVHFAALSLGLGGYVTVADPSGREVYTYHDGDAPGDSARTVHAGGGFAAMSVDGDIAVVTVHASPGASARIDKIWRGYTPAERAARNPQVMSVCSTDARRDVVCYRDSSPTEYARSHAVAKLLIGGGGSCTTWRVGNTNRMLTNNHCISSQADVSAAEVQFNFECATCGGRNPGAGTKVSGATFVKTNPLGRLDYTLFSVNNFASIQRFGTLFLETRAPVAGERIYIAGHGGGNPKQLSIFEDTQGGARCVVGNPASDVFNMGYRCDTSPGSSGSPVLAGSSNKVIALHHLGGCPNEGARINLIFNEIKGLIDNGATP